MGSANQINQNIVTRLKKLESMLGLKPAEMAKLGGCSRATYYRYRNGKSTPTLEFLNKILKYENTVSAEWLLEGEGDLLKEMDGEEKHLTQNFPVDGEKKNFYSFPLHKMHSDDKNGNAVNVHVDGGSTSIPLSKIFLNLLLQNDDSVGYDGAFTMIVEDSCMMPEVKEGGIILVDDKQVTPYSDGIFIVRYDDFVRMKIVQPMPGRKLMLTTLDKKYEPIIVEKDQDGFEILGRIVWTANPM